MLDAWGLMLAAWSLRLVALLHLLCKNGSAACRLLYASASCNNSDGARQMSLVFRIRYILYTTVPALSTFNTLTSL